MKQLFEIFALLNQALPAEDAVRAYLHHSNPLLEGKRPIDLLIRSDFDPIVADLRAIREGVYA